MKTPGTVALQEPDISASPTETPWRYFAAYYLYSWLTEDKNHYEAFQAGVTSANLRKMCVDYGVARCFPVASGATPYAEYEGLATCLKGLRVENPTLGPDAGDCIQERYRAFFASRPPLSNHLLSAFTKGLWFTLREGIVIYDARAWDSLYSRASLRSALRGDDKGGYLGYFKAWHEYYDEHRKAISSACTWLATSAFVSRLRERNAVETQEIEQIQADWFKGRVCDMRLWHRPSQPSTVDQALYLGPNE